MISLIHICNIFILHINAAKVHFLFIIILNGKYQENKHTKDVKHFSSKWT